MKAAGVVSIALKAGSGAELVVDMEVVCADAACAAGEGEACGGALKENSGFAGADCSMTAGAAAFDPPVPKKAGAGVGGAPLLKLNAVLDDLAGASSMSASSETLVCLGSPTVVLPAVSLVGAGVADLEDEADDSATSGVLDFDLDFRAGGTRRFSFAASRGFCLSCFSPSASTAAAARVLRALPGTGGGLGRACFPFGVGRSSGGMLRSSISTAEGGSARLISSSRGTRVV